MSLIMTTWHLSKQTNTTRNPFNTTSLNLAKDGIMFAKPAMVVGFGRYCSTLCGHWLFPSTQVHIPSSSGCSTLHYQLFSPIFQKDGPILPHWKHQIKCLPWWACKMVNCNDCYKIIWICNHIPQATKDDWPYWERLHHWYKCWEFWIPTRIILSC